MPTLETSDVNKFIFRAYDIRGLVETELTPRVRGGSWVGPMAVTSPREGEAASSWVWTTGSARQSSTGPSLKC